MTENVHENPNPFDSFRVTLTVLRVTGFYELPTTSKIIRFCHFMYRILVFIFVIIYNMMHLTYLFLNQKDSGINYGFIIEIPQLNLIAKALTIWINTARIRNLHELIQDPIFAATNKNDAELINENNRIMLKLNRLAIYNVVAGGSLWMISFVFRRLEDPENASVPVYVPFETSSTLGYYLSVLCEVGPVLWSGIGHFGADCIIATYYAQATSQLKILKSNLENLFDKDESIEDMTLTEYKPTEPFQYRDEVNENIRTKFYYYVQRYEKISWYTNEISAIFNNSMSFQFCSTSIIACLVIYEMSSMPILSVLFLHMFILLIIFLMQALLYCFFGHMVEHESQTINTAVYFSDWLSLSPSFRKDILIAMTRWGLPLTPRVSNIVPVSLITFASIVKLSYRLYTVMASRQM